MGIMMRLKGAPSAALAKKGKGKRLFPRDLREIEKEKAKARRRMAQQSRRAGPANRKHRRK